MTQPHPILQSCLPEEQRSVSALKLPSMRPVPPGQWLTVDDAYSGQIEEKARQIAIGPDRVLAVLPEAEAAVQELFSTVLAELAMRPDFRFENGGILCPDGRHVIPDPKAQLLTLAQLVQEDLCLLQKRGDEHVLTAALLCFPAGWTLSEKIGRPLVRIHEPVDHYTPDIAARVQRFFDGVQPGRPLWRANYLVYNEFSLFWPRREGDPKRVPTDHSPYERSERQTVLRLPGTGAVVFSIHTTIARRAVGALT